jgi:hypothetical protein
MNRPASDLILASWSSEQPEMSSQDEKSKKAKTKEIPLKSARPLRKTADPFFTKPVTTSQEIRTYAELRQQIHHDLRIQHPEWVQPNGESPICDSYESRLAELLENFTRTGSHESIAAVHRILE